MLVDVGKPVDPSTFTTPTNILVIAPSDTTQSALWKNCVRQAESKGLSLIPDRNIGRAILTRRADLFCNPLEKVKFIKSQKSQPPKTDPVLLAQQSQTNRSHAPPADGTQVVQQSLTLATLNDDDDSLPVHESPAQLTHT